MDAGLSRSSLNVTDPHQWHTYEQYRVVHDQRLDGDTFIDNARPNTLVFEEIEDEGVVFVYLEGAVYCHYGVTLEVEKLFETRSTGGRLQVRGILYRYVGYVRGGNLVLKYHNLHNDHDEYVHRIYDPATGRQVLFENITRAQFPVMTEVLDELRTLTTGTGDE